MPCVIPLCDSAMTWKEKLQESYDGLKSENQKIRLELWWMKARLARIEKEIRIMSDTMMTAGRVHALKSKNNPSPSQNGLENVSGWIHADGNACNGIRSIQAVREALTEAHQDLAPCDPLMPSCPSLCNEDSDTDDSLPSLPSFHYNQDLFTDDSLPSLPPIYYDEDSDIESLATDLSTQAVCEPPRDPPRDDYNVPRFHPQNEEHAITFARISPCGTSDTWFI